MAGSQGARKLHPTILREYDIRGIVGQTLETADATAIARAFATIVASHGGTRVCVGRDGRLSSPEFEEQTFAGVHPEEGPCTLRLADPSQK